MMLNVREKAYLGNERVWGPKNTKIGFAVKKCSDTYSSCRWNFKISAENPPFHEIIDKKLFSWQPAEICMSAWFRGCSSRFQNSDPSNFSFLCFQNKLFHLLFPITWKRCTLQCNFIDRIFLMINRFPRNTHLMDTFQRARYTKWMGLHGIITYCMHCVAGELSWAELTALALYTLRNLNFLFLLFLLLRCELYRTR